MKISGVQDRCPHLVCSMSRRTCHEEDILTSAMGALWRMGILKIENGDTLKSIGHYDQNCANVFVTTIGKCKSSFLVVVQLPIVYVACGDTRVHRVQ